MKQIYLLLLSILTLGGTTFSQSDSLKKEKGKWTAEFDLLGSYAKNINEVYQFQNNTKVGFVKKRHDLNFHGNISFIKSNSEDLSNAGFSNLQYKLGLDRRKIALLDVFNNTSYDQLQLVKLRNLSGLGISVNILQQDSLKLSITGQGVYEYEELKDENNTINRDVRANFNLDFLWHANKSITIETKAIYNPLVTEWSDFRFTNITDFKFRLNKFTRLKLNFQLRYDSSPAEIDIPNAFYATSLGVEFAVGTK